MDFLQQLHTIRPKIQRLLIPSDDSPRTLQLLSDLDYFLDIIIPQVEFIISSSTSIKEAILELDDHWFITLDNIISNTGYFQHQVQSVKPFDKLYNAASLLKRWSINQVFDHDLAIDELIALLDSSNDHIRIEAVERLSDFPTAIIPIIPDLIQIMIDSNSNLRRAIARTLAIVGDLAVPHVMRLLQKEPSRSERRCAMVTLSTMGYIALEAIADSWPTASDGVRRSFVALLGNHREHPEIVMPMLLEALESTDTGIVIRAMEQLDVFAPFATDALPILETLMKEQRHPIDSRFIKRRLKCIREA